MVSRISEEGERVVVAAVVAASTAACPACGQASARIHSRYARALGDVPACGRPVRVRLAVRRFRCANPACARRTFAEQVPGVTRRHGLCWPFTLSDVMLWQSGCRSARIWLRME